MTADCATAKGLTVCLGFEANELSTGSVVSVFGANGRIAEGVAS
jgi:hypothetical protein